MANNQPDKILRDGKLKVTIWRNEGENGPYWTSVPAKTYTDRDGKLKDTSKLVSAENLRMAELMRESYAVQRELQREHYRSLENQDGQAQRQADDGVSREFENQAPPYEGGSQGEVRHTASRSRNRARSYSR
ncbi:MAG: hypothetical protein AAGA97_00900 [Pseudomonadota bacterium]